MKRIRGGRGLGDSLYLRPVVDYYVRTGAKVTALSDYPDVFIDSGASVEPFRRQNYDVVAHYVSRKGEAGTNQWQDVCLSAKVPPDLPFTIPWKVQNQAKLDRLAAQAAGRAIVLVHGGREPMARRDGYGRELMPEREAFSTVLSGLSDCFTVQIGRAPQIYELRCALNLNNTTSVAELMDLASICDGIVAQCSFAIPLAEAFDKPLLAIWSSKAALSRTDFIRQTTPEKVLSGAHSFSVMDDAAAETLKQAAAYAFRVFH